METDQSGKPAMTKRDRLALKLGVALGLVAGPLVIASLFAAGLVFMAFTILLPLIVSMVAQNRVMILGLLPNALMALTCLLIFGAIAVSSPGPLSRYGAAEIALGILVVVAAAVIPALAVSWLVKFVRRRRASASNADA